MLKLHNNTNWRKQTFIKSSHLFSTAQFSLNKVFKTNNQQYQILLNWATINRTDTYTTAIDWKTKQMEKLPKHIYINSGKKGGYRFHHKDVKVTQTCFMTTPSSNEIQRSVETTFSVHVLPAREIWLHHWSPSCTKTLHHCPPMRALVI